MTKRIQTSLSVLVSLCLPFFVSCSSQDDMSDDIQNGADGNQPHTCELILDVTKSGFDDELQSRADNVEWKNGDKIYLSFTVGSGSSYGDAVYNDGKWTVNYYGTLTEGSTTKCSAIYFDNPDFESGSVVTLSENTGIYEDTNGSYTYNGSTLSVVANLSPKTGRIRFAGSNNDEIKVYGITHYTSYDRSTGKFANSSGAISTKVTSNYTPYIYGEFSDLEHPRLNIITSTSGYTRLLSTSIFKAGESGYMNIPTESSYSGWQNSVIFKVNGVEFTMIPVTYSSGNFLLAETETTEELYKAIIGTGNSSQYPKTGISNNSWTDFISKLNSITELSFRIPTSYEWKYAAQGGNKSQNYTYSGSNIISDVAWYVDNSNGNKHLVKQLQPNELGFYDINGNVMEYVSGGYYYGGHYNSSESECKVTSYITYASSNNYWGLRIALSNK